MFYVHYHGNSGCLVTQLPGNTKWTFFEVEYAMDRLLDIKESTAQQIKISELPDGITNDFDFNRTKERVREIYKLL